MKVLFKELIGKLLEGINIPIYVKMGNEYFLHNNKLKQINISDYFKKQLNNNKSNIAGFFKDNLVEFRVIELELGEDKLYLIIPKFYDLNSILIKVFSNAFKIYREKQHIEEKLKSEIKQLEKDRDKFELILNGQGNLFFVVDLDYNIKFANISLAKLLGCGTPKQLINKKCFKIVYKLDKPCKWCKMSEITSIKQQINQEVDTYIDGKKYCYDQIMYPVVFDNSVINIVESLNDITTYKEIAESMEKIDEEKKQIARKNLNNLKEIGALKKAYNEIYNEYLNTTKQVDKLNLLINKLVEYNNVRKSIELSEQLKNQTSENMLLKDKLKNTTARLSNYEKNIKELKNKAIYEINRLGNIIKNRKELDSSDIEKFIAFLDEHIKKYIKEDDNVS
ncbi:MAG: PAS domain-containing protein [Deferribacterota bacterium]|nr:PAS domain-containing protein [Deferribacterota bacterium]